MKLANGGLRLATLAFVAAATVPSAFGAIIFNLGAPINGSIPDGVAPYASATLENNGANTVKVTLKNLAPTSNFIVRFNLNLTSNIDVSFAHLSGNVADSTTDGPNHSDGHPSMMAGLFDIVFSYPTSNSNPNRFKGGEDSIYNLTGTGLDETDFLAQSTGGYMAAARFQGISNDGSGTVGLVPEPASLAAVAVGLAALRRRRK